MSPTAAHAGASVDLHPDDFTARLRVQAALRERRTSMGLSAQEVARRAGFAREDAVRLLERLSRTSWEAWRVQQWARGLDHVFRLEIVGLTVPDDDMTSLVLRSTTAFGGFDEDQLHLQIVAADLVRTRQAMGVARSELARRCGVDERAIREFEKSPLQSWLRTYQRYARALSGALALGLEPVPVEVLA